MEFSMEGSTYVVPTAHRDHNALNLSYNEILKLNTMLDNAKIPHMIRRLDDGWQVIYSPYHPDSSWVTDAIETRYSYGSEDDLLELAGKLLTEEELKRDSVVGGLTANNVFERISKHWEEHKKELNTIFERISKHWEEHKKELNTIFEEKDVNWIE